MNSLSDGEVDIDYIRAVLLPEQFASRQVSLGYAPSMIVQSSASFPLISTATGSGYMFLSPDYSQAPSGTGLGDSFAIGNPSAYSPSTGAVTGS